MASSVLTVTNGQFPVGTLVGAYTRKTRHDGTSPSSAALDTDTVSANSTLTFDGLPDNAEYTAYALVGGSHRYQDFSTRPPAASTITLDVAALQTNATVVKEAALDPAYPEFGAVGDGTTDDSAAIQAAVNAAGAALKGEVILPDHYRVDTALTFPLNNPITLRGVGKGRPLVGGTRLARTGTNPIISAVGTGDTNAGRVAVTLKGLVLDGGGTAGAVLKVQRANDVLIDDVRVGWSAGIGAQFTQLWNCDIDHLRVHNCGSGTTSPAVLFDAVAGAGSQGGSATVHCSNWELEGNLGTELRLTGSVADGAPTNDVKFSNLKIEGGSGSFPFIDLFFAQLTVIEGLQISRAAARSGTMIEQLGSSTGAAGNVITGYTIDGRLGTATSHFVDCGVGALVFGPGVILGSGIVNAAIFRVRNTVSAGRFGYNPALITSEVQRNRWVLDERGPATVASAATIVVPAARVASVTGTATVTTIATTEPGHVITLVFASTATLTDGGNIKLAGAAANFTATADDAITLVCDGTSWIETGRAVN